jgi:transposase
VATRRRRRNWDDEEKRMICAQTRVPGVSVSQVARRYDVNANQVLNWLKEPRFADPEPREPECWATTEPAFLPVEITEPRDMTVLSDSAEPGTLEIDLAGGQRLLITGAYDADALVRLIRGLSS